MHDSMLTIAVLVACSSPSGWLLTADASSRHRSKEPSCSRVGEPWVVSHIRVGWGRWAGVISELYG